MVHAAGARGIQGGADGLNRSAVRPGSRIPAELSRFVVSPDKEFSMKSTKALLSAAALTGLLTGTASVNAATVFSTSHAQSQVTRTAGVKAIGMDDTTKHDCAGKNGCKGQGGCSSSDAGCKGKNSCKGKGGCRSS